MTAIEKFLHEHFASLDDADPEAPPSSSTGLPVLPDSQPERLDEPFAKVNTVAARSPADQAGLKPGDEIRNFGYVNRSNQDNLRRVAECVQGNEGVGRGVQKVLIRLANWKKNNIFIKVSRSTGAAQKEELRLTLTPRKDWGGRGLLGCHILPL